MVDIKIGQTIRIGASVWDFCGNAEQFIHVQDVQINADPSVFPQRCQDISGIEIIFKLAGIVTATQCRDCVPDVLYSTIGSAYTDDSGRAYIDYVVTEADYVNYQNALASGVLFKALACIKNSKGQKIGWHGCSDAVTVLSAVAPTHFITLSMGFVPPELVSYFEAYISQISQYLMTQIAPPPAPWNYVGTTYNRVTNAFNLWLYLPPSANMSMMSPGPLDDIINWISSWGGLIMGAIMIILALFVPMAGLYVLLLLIGGVAILSWSLYDAKTAQIRAEQIAKNLDIQVNINNNFDKGKEAIDDAWGRSGQSQTDCTTRLGGFRDFFLTSVLNSYAEKYAKYADITTALQSEKTAFLSAANSIITEFGTKPYSADVCNTYYAQLDSAVTASKVRINELVSRYIIPDQPYEVACKGWSNQGDCETAECFWYDGACHKEQACWIPSPLGGCVLSARTGKIIVGTVATLTILGVAYWLATRKPREVREIITGAREAVAVEAERARAMYRGLRAPPVPRLTGAPAVPA